MILRAFGAGSGAGSLPRGSSPREAGRSGAQAVAGLLAMQASIGIATLVLMVPLWAGLLHQAFAMIVLGMAVTHAQAISKAH